MGTAARAPHIPFVGATAHLLGESRQLPERSRTQGWVRGLAGQPRHRAILSPALTVPCTHSADNNSFLPLGSWEGSSPGKDHTGLFTHGSALVVSGRLSLEPMELLLGSSAPFSASAGVYQAPCVPGTCYLLSPHHLQLGHQWQETSSH